MSSALKSYQRDFIQFVIENKVLTFGSFKLKSGRTSPYFFNAGLFNTGSLLAKLGSFYAAALIDTGLSYDILFGPAYKGIPLVCTTVISLALNHATDAPYAFNRKEIKDHGEGGGIVGSPLVKDARVFVIDDVITAGTAIRESVGIISAHGAKLCGVLIALDRQEKGSDLTMDVSAIGEVERELKVPVISIVKLQDIVSYLQEEKGVDHEDQISAILEYKKQYGA